MNPIKPALKTEIAPVLLVIMAIILSFYFYAQLPETVVTHWNFEGQPDGWSSKSLASFLMPAIIIGMYLMFLFIPYLDPKKKRYAEFRKIYHLFKTLIVSFMFLIYLATGLANLGYPVDIGTIVPTLVGVMFIIMGNYMGKIKFNWFVGIKTPWTLSSENVWNQTHRVSGWLFVILGLVLIIIPYLNEGLVKPIFFISIAVVVLGSMGYSYYLYRKEKQ